jgi:Ca-activated chloride channel homolog
MNWAATLLAAFSLLQDPYTLKLDVPVVSIDVTVLDGKDNLVNNLTKDDFLIYENGIPQEIRFFSPVSTPYHVFLLFDSSDSTRNNRDFMRNAAAKLIENLRPQDSIAVGSFADNFQLNLPWSTDHKKAAAVLDALARPNESNETRLYACGPQKQDLIPLGLG